MIASTPRSASHSASRRRRRRADDFAARLLHAPNQLRRGQAEMEAHHLRPQLLHHAASRLGEAIDRGFERWLGHLRAKLGIIWRKPLEPCRLARNVLLGLGMAEEVEIDRLARARPDRRDTVTDFVVGQPGARERSEPARLGHGDGHVDAARIRHRRLHDRQLNAEQIEQPSVRPSHGSQLLRIPALAEQPQAERVQLDEAGRVLLVVGAGVVLEGDDLVGIERFRARPADDDDIALVELERDLALDMLLALVDQRLQHLALRREPEAVIDELGIARHQRVLQMHRLAVERERLDRPVRHIEDGAARRLVDAARLHADKRFSTRSTRPMPLSRPSSLSRVSSAAGDSALPSIETGSPCLKPILTMVALSGASSGAMVR